MSVRQSVHGRSLVGGVIQAAIFEMAGVLIAGGDVVGTIKSGIITPGQILDKEVFIWLMTAAPLAAAADIRHCVARRYRPPTPSSAACSAPVLQPAAGRSPTGARWRKSPPAG